MVVEEEALSEDGSDGVACAPDAAGDDSQEQRDGYPAEAAREKEARNLVANLRAEGVDVGGKLLVGGGVFDEQCVGVVAEEVAQMEGGDAEVIGGGFGGAIHRYGEVAGVEVLAVGEDNGFALLCGQGANDAEQGEEGWIGSSGCGDERVWSGRRRRGIRGRGV